MKKLLLASAILLSCPFVYADGSCTQYNNDVSQGLLGLDGADGALYITVKSVSNECACTAYRFKPSNTDVKSALSIALFARASNKKLRIDLINGADCNSAYRVYLQ